MPLPSARSALQSMQTSPRSASARSQFGEKRVTSLAAELQEETKLSSEEFQALLETFKRLQGNKEGLNKKQFAEVVKEALSKRFSEDILPAFYRIYEVFDSDGNGTIDFIELATGISTLMYGRTDEIIKMLFSLIDVDGSGTVEKDEMVAFFKKYFSGQTKMHGYHLTKQRWNVLKDYLDRTFSATDENGNGIIEYDEFLKSIQDPDSPIAMIFYNMTGQGATAQPMA